MKAQLTYIILIIFAIIIRLALAASLEKFDSCSRSQFILSFSSATEAQATSQLTLLLHSTSCVEAKIQINTQNINVQCVAFSNRYINTFDTRTNNTTLQTKCVFFQISLNSAISVLLSHPQNSKVRLFCYFCSLYVHLSHIRLDTIHTSNKSFYHHYLCLMEREASVFHESSHANMTTANYYLRTIFDKTALTSN